MSQTDRLQNDPGAYAWMKQKFPESKKQVGRDRNIANCPECGGKGKLWWADVMPHNGACYACGYSFPSVFSVEINGVLYRTSGYQSRGDLTDMEKLVYLYRKDGKQHRLSDTVIRAFGLRIATLDKKDGTGKYNNISFPSSYETNKRGYIKHLNFSGRWISVPGKERGRGEKWLGLNNIKLDDETIYVLAGEWDLFAFYELTKIYGISPVDGESSPRSMGPEDLDVFANRHVVIFFDNDKAGYRGGRALAQQVAKYHKTKSIRVVDLTRIGLKGGQDIDDYVSGGGRADRLFDEIELTPDFTGSLIDTNAELSRISAKIPMPNAPDSVLAKDVLEKIWAMITLPESRRYSLMCELAESEGYSRQHGAAAFKSRVETYYKEMQTLRFLAYDILVDDACQTNYVKKLKSRNELESEKYYYYKDGYYHFVTDSFYDVVSDNIARSITPPDNRRDLSTARRQASEDIRIKMLDMASVDFNQSNHYINFANGAYDLNSRRLLDHSPTFNLAYKLPVAFNSEALCDNFQTALAVWLKEEEDQREFLKALYYLISSDRSLEVVLWLYGLGEDGKTQATRLMQALVGEERTSAVAVEDLDRPHSTATLFGKILNIADEVGAKHHMNDAQFKRITGNSLITVDPKHKDPITFFSQALWVLPSNALPSSSDSTHGYNRRF